MLGFSTSVNRRIDSGEKAGMNTLEEMAESYAQYVEEVWKSYSSLRGDRDFQRLCKVDGDDAIKNAYLDKEGKWRSMAEIEEKKIPFAKCRQILGTVEHIEIAGRSAHLQLKSLLLDRSREGGIPRKWAEMDKETGKQGDNASTSVSDGLVDFLQRNNATVYDPGLRPMEEIERAMRVKYNNDRTRVRNRSRLIFEFRSAKDLVTCLFELKTNTRFSVTLIRNCFAQPTALGARYVLVYAEVVPHNAPKFICEIRMVINPSPSSSGCKTFKIVEDLQNKIKSVLRDHCQITQEQLDSIAEFIFYEMNSRAIRHQDMVFLRSDASAQDFFMRVNKERVTVTSQNMNQRNLFIIERVDGYGPVKTGDVIQLQNQLTGKWLDASGVNFGIKCRIADQCSESSYLKFVVERAPKIKDTGVIAGLAAFAAAESNLTPTDPKEIKAMKRKAAPPIPMTIINGSQIMLKIYGLTSPVRRITTVKPAAWNSSEQLLKADKLMADNVSVPQHFSIFREGSLKAFVDAVDLAIEQEKQSDFLFSQVQTKEANQMDLLKTAFMAPALQPHAPQEGGVFRRSPPTFRDIALTKLSFKVVNTILEDDDENDGKVSGEAMKDKELFLDMSTLPAMAIAAICRCAYSLVELHKLDDSISYVVDEMLGTIDGSNNFKLPRFLSLAVAAGTDVETGLATQDSMLAASISSKMLRVFTAVLHRMPALSLPANPNRRPQVNMDDAAAQAYYQKLEDDGEYDKKRLEMLQVFSTYLSKFLATPVLQRLAVASQRPLSKSEIVLLLEVCRAVNAIARAFYGNELRCPTTMLQSGGNAIKDAPRDTGAIENTAQSAVANGSPMQGSTAIVPLQQDVLAERQGGEGAVSGSTMFGFADAQEEIRCIRGVLEAEIFSTLVPAPLIRILVHSLLNGMKLEALAYAAQRSIASDSEECVKLVSALVQDSIQALATCMHGCEGPDGLEEFSCDYNVCEAISQAMSNGGQFVPKARVTQLMQEWHFEKHRTSIQQKLQDVDEFDKDIYGNPISLKPHPTEKVFIMGIVWTATFSANDPIWTNLLPTDITRRICVITSRLNLLLLTLPDEQSVARPDIPSPDDLDVVQFSNLSRVQRMVVHPRMRQFIGLKWDEPQPVQKCQALIFENQHRRRDFLEALKLVTRFRPPVVELGPDVALDIPGPGVRLETGPNKAIRISVAREEMVLTLRKTCKPSQAPRAEVQLVNVSFVKASDEAVLYGGVGMEVLVLTRDSLTIVPLTHFLKIWADSEATPPPQQSVLDDIEDSDPDQDSIAPPAPGDLTNIDIEPWVTDIVQPRPMKTLTGVWFLADPEPKVKLEFDHTVEIQFFSDGDRQRFRQHLACVLKLGDEGEVDAKAAAEQGRMWRVQPTGEQDLATVKKEVREVEVNVEKHAEHVQKMAKLALGN
jgi:hypothetical protein